MFSKDSFWNIFVPELVESIDVEPMNTECWLILTKAQNSSCNAGEVALNIKKKRTSLKPHTFTKINSKWIADSNAKHKTVKVSNSRKSSGSRARPRSLRHNIVIPPKEKLKNWASSKCNSFVLQEILLKGWKGKLQTRRKHLRTTELFKNLDYI
jgi:hypothetical protein